MHTKADDFIRITAQAIQQVQEENGAIANLNIIGRHVELKAQGQAVVISDIHGDLESLVHILQESRILERMKQSTSTSLIFLGDYGDRGDFSVEVYYTVLKLKLQHPTQIVLMRGNHEGPKDLLVSPHDLPSQFQAKFGKKWTQAYETVLELFPHLYVSLRVERRYLMVHGGLPQEAQTIEDFAFAHQYHPKLRFLEDILWSDPLESSGDLYPSPRGAGRLFGRAVTEKVLKALGVRVLIRGHEPCDNGFRVSHDGRILTLFSRKDEPYYNTYGAYLDVDLSEMHESADQLVPYVHKF